jgi:surface protein
MMNISTIISINTAFKNAEVFNSDISKWNTSRVTNFTTGKLVTNISIYILIKSLQIND